MYSSLGTDVKTGQLKRSQNFQNLFLKSLENIFIFYLHFTWFTEWILKKSAFLKICLKISKGILILFSNFFFQTISHSGHLDLMHLPEYIFILACVHVLIWFLVLTFIGGNLLTDFLLHSQRDYKDKRCKCQCLW